MKTSELISKLQELQEEHGDLEVVINTESYLIREIVYSSSCQAIDIVLSC